MALSIAADQAARRAGLPINQRSLVIASHGRAKNLRRIWHRLRGPMGPRDRQQRYRRGHIRPVSCESTRFSSWPDRWRPELDDLGLGFSYRQFPRCADFATFCEVCL